MRLGRSVDGVLSFEEGWEVFVNHHGLNIGEMVVFEHKGKMVFNVVAYESLGSEKEYELQSDKHQHDYKGGLNLKFSCISHKNGSGILIFICLHFPQDLHQVTLYIFACDRIAPS